MKQLLIATGNAGKISEFRALLSADDVRIVSLPDLKVESPEETGATFEENAVLKARHAARVCELVAVADDSGIVVDALDGAPGVISARFSGPNATDASNRELLLRRLEESGSGDRTARFVCVIAVAHPDGRVETFDGSLEGTIATEERGTGGFGYDPIFELSDGMTVAQLSPEQKNRISHRAMALRKALPYIRSVLDADA